VTRLALLSLWLLLPVCAQATESFDPRRAKPCETERWAKLELLEDADEHMVQEPFTDLVAHTDPELVAAFGSKTPPSSQFLLHYAPGWDAPQASTPVLLVHGAGLTSNHCFTDHPIEQPYEGLANRLARAGRATFAITFAHPHGDNFLQAEAVADAIARIKLVTGAKTVDLVAHSKGGMSTRIYLSDAGPDWATAYRGDVRRYVMLGTPNGGIDVSFAYPNLNYWILENTSPAPLSWTRCLYYGVWKDFDTQTIYGDGWFPGQAQMVARWDARYGRTTAKGQFDVDATYEGGRGTVSVSRGIDAAIRDGGHLIEKLQRKGVHPDVELAILAGTSPWIMHMVGERRAPSDGLLLVASAFSTDGLTRRGATLIRKDLRHLNHLQLVYDPRANEWVLEVLDR
jgi:hypothetical protein